MIVLCAVSGCRTGRCEGPGNCTPLRRCQGCFPRTAADGLRICYPHRLDLARDAVGAAIVWRDLLGVLVTEGASGLGERVSTTPERGLQLNTAAVESRELIEGTLRAWSKMIVDERGIIAPADDVGDLAAYIGGEGRYRRLGNADWLAAHPAAADAVAEMREIARGRPWSVAHPTGVRTRIFGPCPQPECTGIVRARSQPAGSPYLSVAICSAQSLHRWYWDTWADLAAEIAARAAHEG